MIETERLVLRKYTMDDLPFLTVQRRIPEVARFIGGLELQTPEFIEKRVRFTIGNYEKGLGMCAMIWKETGENIGWSGLQPLEDSGEIEVGYGMVESFWRRGIGLECASAWLRYGFSTLGLERIVAVANKENTGSWRIMEKCGMAYEGMRDHYGMNLVYYAIDSSSFLRGENER
ncbi:MAG: GNAT family N-acetyltransferase [Acidobacteria bacterium]|nr:GNAT family N-acetyltransferase [Acidobacteriota bacterium]MBK8149409.1 GNAT family N-acetyltransferase [Acidobacteriota bacterium]MBK8813838.1 GNAT family N-acetyltransferase [Acidobacteriota bacterium]